MQNGVKVAGTKFTNSQGQSTFIPTPTEEIEKQTDKAMVTVSRTVNDYANKARNQYKQQLKKEYESTYSDSNLKKIYDKQVSDILKNNRHVKVEDYNSWKQRVIKNSPSEETFINENANKYDAYLNKWKQNTLANAREKLLSNGIISYQESLNSPENRRAINDIIYGKIERAKQLNAQRQLKQKNEQIEKEYKNAPKAAKLAVNAVTYPGAVGAVEVVGNSLAGAGKTLTKGTSGILHGKGFSEVGNIREKTLSGNEKILKEQGVRSYKSVRDISTSNSSKLAKTAKLTVKSPEFTVASSVAGGEAFGAADAGVNAVVNPLFGSVTARTINVGKNVALGGLGLYSLYNTGENVANLKSTNPEIKEQAKENLLRVGIMIPSGYAGFREGKTATSNFMNVKVRDVQLEKNKVLSSKTYSNVKNNGEYQLRNYAKSEVGVKPSLTRGEAIAKNIYERTPSKVRSMLEMRNPDETKFFTVNSAAYEHGKIENAKTLQNGMKQIKTSGFQKQKVMLQEIKNGKPAGEKLFISKSNMPVRHNLMIKETLRAEYPNGMSSSQGTFGDTSISAEKLSSTPSGASVTHGTYTDVNKGKITIEARGRVKSMNPTVSKISETNVYGNTQPKTMGASLGQRQAASFEWKQPTVHIPNYKSNTGFVSLFSPESSGLSTGKPNLAILFKDFDNVAHNGVAYAVPESALKGIPKKPSTFGISTSGNQRVVSSTESKPITNLNSRQAISTDVSKVSVENKPSIVKSLSPRLSQTRPSSGGKLIPLKAPGVKSQSIITQKDVNAAVASVRGNSITKGLPGIKTPGLKQSNTPKITTTPTFEKIQTSPSSGGGSMVKAIPSKVSNKAGVMPIEKVNKKVMINNRINGRNEKMLHVFNKENMRTMSNNLVGTKLAQKLMQKQKGSVKTKLKTEPVQKLGVSQKLRQMQVQKQMQKLGVKSKIGTATVTGQLPVSFPTFGGFGFPKTNKKLVQPKVSHPKSTGKIKTRKVWEKYNVKPDMFAEFMSNVKYGKATPLPYKKALEWGKKTHWTFIPTLEQSKHKKVSGLITKAKSAFSFSSFKPKKRKKFSLTL